MIISPIDSRASTLEYSKSYTLVGGNLEILPEQILPCAQSVSFKRRRGVSLAVDHGTPQHPRRIPCQGRSLQRKLRGCRSGEEEEATAPNAGRVRDSVRGNTRDHRDRRRASFAPALSV
jgi:hypothetical protein